MSQLTLLLLQGGFLVLLWFFVFGVVYSLRADLFGVKVRKLPEPSASAVPAAAAPTSSPDAVTTQVKRPAAPTPVPAGGLATTSAVSRIVITSGPKAGLELPLGTEPLTIGRSSESGLVIRDDYTSSHHARLVLWGEQWDAARPRFDERHLARRRPRGSAGTGQGGCSDQGRRHDVRVEEVTLPHGLPGLERRHLPHGQGALQQPGLRLRRVQPLRGRRRHGRSRGR
ncbi:hypothetical protein QE418_001257 [Microbacterium testaceum]|nr:hypothetical protein [Microbacterium testaceum]